jgi:hypothetical protein
MMKAVDTQPAAQPLDPQVAAARAEVLRAVEDSASYRDGPLRPPSLYAKQSLGEPPTGLAVKLAARSRAGLPVDGWYYPRAALWLRVVLPVAVVAVLDLLGMAAITAAALVAGWQGLLMTLLTLCSGLLVLLVLTAAPVAAYARRDPLRLTSGQQRLLSRSRHWASSQPWLRIRSDGPERRLVSVACDEAGRIASSRAWASRHLDEHRLRLDLAGELDQIDRQAFQLAELRVHRAEPAGDSPPAAAGPDSATAPAWNALVDRVAALRVYADTVAALEPKIAELEAEENTARIEGSLMQIAAGSVQDEFAAADLRALTDDLRRLDGRPTV